MEYRIWGYWWYDRIPNYTSLRENPSVHWAWGNTQIPFLVPNVCLTNRYNALSSFLTFVSLDPDLSASTNHYKIYNNYVRVVFSVMLLAWNNYSAKFCHIIHQCYVRQDMTELKSKIHGEVGSFYFYGVILMCDEKSGSPNEYFRQQG